MNVWVVSYDESENADDPLLRVFESYASARHAVLQMEPNLVDELEDGEVTIMRYDPEEGERVQLHIREVRIEAATTITTGVV